MEILILKGLITWKEDENMIIDPQPWGKIDPPWMRRIDPPLGFNDGPGAE